MRSIGGLDRVAADRALLERLRDAGAELALVEGLARAVVLDDLRHDELGGLEGREALAAGQAFAPAADLVPLAREARVRHLGVVVVAERAVHGRGPGALTRRPESARRSPAPPRARASDGRLVAHAVEHVGDPVADLPRLRFPEAAGRDRRRADAQAARHERRPRVVRHGVLVDRDVRAPERRVGILARVVLADQVEQEQVVVGAAGDDAVAAVLQRLRHRARVLDHLPLVRLELGRERLEQRDRLGGDHVHQRTALQCPGRPWN